jgi:putative FmdB family regulatory protein
MPTYEYKCKHCGHEMEALQSITADPLTRCPKCRRKGLVRLISAGVGLIFKGSGFYVTDYKLGKSVARTEPSSDSGPAVSESAGGTAGTDSGPGAEPSPN